MDRALAIAGEALPIALKNAQFSITLAGWPAAVAVVAVCCAGTAVYAISSMQPNYT